MLAWQQSAAAEYRLLPLERFLLSSLSQSPPLSIVYLTLGFFLRRDLLLDDTYQASVGI